MRDATRSDLARVETPRFKFTPVIQAAIRSKRGVIIEAGVDFERSLPHSILDAALRRAAYGLNVLVLRQWLGGNEHLITVTELMYRVKS